MAYLSQPVSEEVISVYIFSSVPFIIRALKREVEDDENHKVLHSFTDAKAAEAALRFFSPAIAIVDFEFNNCRGAAFARSIKQYNPDTIVIAFSEKISNCHIMCMLDAGARAYISHNMDDHEFTDAIHCLLSGTLFYNKNITDALMEEYRQYRNDPDAPFRAVFDDKLLDILQRKDAGDSYLGIANGDLKVSGQIGKYVGKFTARYNCDVYGLIRLAKARGQM